MKMNEKVIKGIGLGATLVGVAASLVSNWVGEKNLDSKIAKEVTKAVAEKATKGES